MSITETLKKRAIRTLNKQHVYEDVRAKAVSAHAAYTKEVLGGAVEDTMPVELVALKTAYYSMLADYKHGHMKTQKKPSQRSIKLWTRVEAARQRAGCSPERFMRAQFSWFDKTFGTCPAISQLATDAAVDRALEFTGNEKARVVGPVTHKSSLAEVFRVSDQLVRDMMEAQGCTREEFYRRFVVTGIQAFPEEFLNADPCWHKART